MGAALLNSCAVQLSEAPFCSPIPGSNLAACDDFITHNPQTLDWNTVVAQWQAKGWALECTNSDVVANLKREIEQLCTNMRCTVETQQAVSLLVMNLNLTLERAQYPERINP